MAVRNLAKLKGVQLTSVAKRLGLKRRWWGLEPDKWLRQRVVVAVNRISP